AADAPIALRLGIRLDSEAESLRDRPDVAAEIGFVEPEHHQCLQREERQKHVGVDVGDDARRRHGRMGGEVARPELAFFLAGHRKKQNGTRGRWPSSWSWVATSMMAAVPDALSIAPL